MLEMVSAGIVTGMPATLARGSEPGSAFFIIASMGLPSILYWEDPIQSGAVFGTVLVVLLSLASYSLITVVSYTCLTLLMLVLAVKLYSYVMVMLKKAEPGSDPLAMVAAMPVTVPADTISNMSPCVAKTLNNFTTELRRLFLVENMVDTIKFGLSLWLLTYLGSWFNFLTLVILAWLGLFTAPKLYINNQAQVDEVVGKVMAQVEEVKGKVVALIPNKAALKKNELLVKNISFHNLCIGCQISRLHGSRCIILVCSHLNNPYVLLTRMKSVRNRIFTLF
jgi:hypothetical protein